MQSTKHEYRHFIDDKDSGYKGFRLLANPKIAAQLEASAYDVEIEFAKSSGYNDIAKKLEELKKKRIEEICQ